MPGDKSCWKCNHHVVCFILREAKEFFNSNLTSHRISDSIEMLTHPGKFDLSYLLKLICMDCRHYD